MNFKDILEILPTIDHLTGLDVLNGEAVIHHIPADQVSLVRFVFIMR